MGSKPMLSVDVRILVRAHLPYALAPSRPVPPVDRHARLANMRRPQRHWLVRGSRAKRWTWPMCHLCVRDGSMVWSMMSGTGPTQGPVPVLCL